MTAELNLFSQINYGVNWQKKFDCQMPIIQCHFLTCEAVTVAYWLNTYGC